MTISENKITEFYEYLISEEKSPKTIEKYIRDIKEFARWLGSRKLCKQEMLIYKDRLLSEYAPASVNSILSSLNSFFAHNEMYGLRVKNVKIQRQMFANEDKMLTKDEYERLLDAAKDKKNEKLMLIMQTICATGIRVSELQFITVDAVNIGKAVVKLKGKIRTIFLPSQLCGQLKRYIRENGIAEGCIFINRNGNPIDRTSIWKAMKSLCQIANVERTKVFPHNLRHLFARTYYSIQKDIVRLADILGHSSVNTTRIYTIENGNIHRMQIQELGLVRMKI